MGESEEPRKATLGSQPFHSLRDAARILGFGYKKTRALAGRGYFGELTRSGDAGLGVYLVPDAVLTRLVNGEPATGEPVRA